jgi:two-component SAPR family response regulator
VDEDWFLADRERHRQLHMHALEALSRHLVESGEYGRAVDAAYAAIAVEPLYESAHAALDPGAFCRGQPHRGHRQFTAFHRLLYEERRSGRVCPCIGRRHPGLVGSWTSNGSRGS